MEKDLTAAPSIVAVPRLMGGVMCYATITDRGTFRLTDPNHLFVPARRQRPPIARNNCIERILIGETQFFAMRPQKIQCFLADLLMLPFAKVDEQDT